jgi:hypothetical protein
VLSASALFALPGIVIHELGHYLLCRLCGAAVQEVVFFDAAGPSGYVLHSVPRRVVQHVTIVGGPLILNSILGFLLFRATFAQLGLILDRSTGLAALTLLQLVASALVGSSVALHALPSAADASSLWRVILDRVSKGNLLAILAAPIALALMLANRLRRYWIDWIYAAALAAAALWLPVR